MIQDVQIKTSRKHVANSVSYNALWQLDQCISCGATCIASYHNCCRSLIGDLAHGDQAAKTYQFCSGTLTMYIYNYI